MGLRFKGVPRGGRSGQVRPVDAETEGRAKL